jgi:hypothetical protein
MLTSRILSTLDECWRYASLYRQHTQRHGFPIQLEPEYLRRSTVRVFFRANQPDVWLGGYVLNLTAPVRYLGFADEARQAQLLAPYGLNVSDFVEIAGAWRVGEKSLADLVNRAQFYTDMMTQAVATGRRAVLGGCFIEKSQPLHRQVMPHVLYDGPFRVGEAEGRAQVYFGYRAGLLGRYYRAAIGDTWQRFWQSRGGGSTPPDEPTPPKGPGRPLPFDPPAVDLTRRSAYVGPKSA